MRVRCLGNDTRAGPLSLFARSFFWTAACSRSASSQYGQEVIITSPELETCAPGAYPNKGFDSIIWGLCAV